MSYGSIYAADGDIDHTAIITSDNGDTNKEKLLTQHKVFIDVKHCQQEMIILLNIYINRILLFMVMKWTKYL